MARASLMVAALAMTWSAAPTDAATSGTTVGATVPSAVSLDDSGCRSGSALDLGSLATGTWAIGAACTVSFGSSNDTARLRLWQRDETAPAMESNDRTWTTRSGSTRWYTVASGATANTAWAAGLGGPGEATARFEKTTDGGANWSAAGLTTCGGQVLIDLDAFSDTTLWSASTTRICRSTDGGQSWTTDYVIAGGVFAQMVMISPTLGYAIGNGTRLYRTTDGVSWSDLGAIASSNFNYFGSIHADALGNIVIGARTSSAGTSSYGVVWSTNGGTSWSEQVLATAAGPDTSGVYGALVVNASTLLVSGPYMRTMRGVFSAGTWTWTTVLTTTLSHVPYVRSPDGAIFGTSGADRLYRSTDSGATWTSLPMNTGATPFQRDIAGNGNQILVVGYANRRLASADAGSTWTAAASKPSWYAALAWNATTMFVAGWGGAAARSTDGGVSFTPQAIGTSVTITDGVTYPGGVGVLVGGVGTILRTTDYGATWNPVTSPAASEPWSEVTTDDQNTTWIVSSNGAIASSTDRGATWTLEAAVPGAPSLQALSAWRGQLWVGGTGGGVWRSSTTRPLSWTSVPTPRTATVTSIWAIDATTAVALTDYEAAPGSSHLSRTTNGGSTWSVATTGAVAHTRDIATDDSHRYGWLTSASVLMQSTDRGISWGPAVSVGNPDYINRVEPTSAGRLLAVGDSSLISTSAPASSLPDGLGGSSGFGACLESATGVATTGWVVSGAGNCTSAIPSNWNPIAADPTSAGALLATTATSGTGVLAIRFGVRVGNATSASYAANLVFEAIAPATA